MRRFLNWLSRKRFPYEPLITVSISRSAIINNLAEFRKLITSGYIAPVLKSNAYGHGLIEVASILAKESGIPFFVVDSYFEAVALRAKGINKPLLIVGYTRPRTILESNLHNVAFTISNLETLKSLSEAKTKISLHIKIDTGMHRQGIVPDEFYQVIDILKSNNRLVLEGLCTHFSDADNTDESFTESQIAAWNRSAETFRQEFPHIWYMHAAATDGSRYSHDMTCNVIRLGIGLYGLSDNPKLNETLRLEPALEMNTTITSFKMLPKGETVGYANTFRATHDMCIANIPVGYYEGLDRRLSNKGVVEVGPDKSICPFVGRISMNISTIDVTTIMDKFAIESNLPVVVISRDRNKPNSLHSMAKQCGTIVYELVVKIPAHLRRVIVK